MQIYKCLCHLKPCKTLPRGGCLARWPQSCHNHCSYLHENSYSKPRLQMRLKSKTTEFTWGLCFKSNIRKMENEAENIWAVIWKVRHQHTTTSRWDRGYPHTLIKGKCGGKIHSDHGYLDVRAHYVIKKTKKTIKKVPDTPWWQGLNLTHCQTPKCDT